MSRRVSTPKESNICSEILFFNILCAATLYWLWFVYLSDFLCLALMRVVILVFTKKNFLQTYFFFSYFHLTTFFWMFLEGKSIFLTITHYYACFNVLYKVFCSTQNSTKLKWLVKVKFIAN